MIEQQGEHQGCPEWLEAVSAYLDGALAVDEEQRVHAHLRACPGCAETLVDLVPVVQTLRALPPVAPTRDLWPELSKQLRDDAAFREGARQAAWTAWSRPALGAAAAVAAVVVGGGLTLVGYRNAEPPAPIADVDTYWQQHDAFDQDQGLPTRYAPDLGAIEASYDLDD
jgi:anti-sigma factor RsiW